MTAEPNVVITVGTAEGQSRVTDPVAAERSAQAAGVWAQNRLNRRSVMTDITEQAQALLDAATPGPWEWEWGCSWLRGDKDDDGYSVDVLLVEGGMTNTGLSDADAAFIAAAPKLVSGLLSALTEARTAAEDWERRAHQSPNGNLIGLYRHAVADRDAARTEAERHRDLAVQSGYVAERSLPWEV